MEETHYLPLTPAYPKVTGNFAMQFYRKIIPTERQSTLICCERPILTCMNVNNLITIHLCQCSYAIFLRHSYILIVFSMSCLHIFILHIHNSNGICLVVSKRKSLLAMICFMKQIKAKALELIHSIIAPSPRNQNYQQSLILPVCLICYLI